MTPDRPLCSSAAGLDGLDAELGAVALAAALGAEGVRDVAVQADLLLQAAVDGFSEGHGCSLLDGFADKGEVYQRGGARRPRCVPNGLVHSPLELARPLFSFEALDRANGDRRRGRCRPFFAKNPSQSKG